MNEYLKEQTDGNHDLFPMWKEDAYKEEIKKLNKVKNAYSCLNDKETSYAKGMCKMIKLRENIIHQFRYNYAIGIDDIEFRINDAAKVYADEREHHAEWSILNDAFEAGANFMLSELSLKTVEHG